MLSRKSLPALLALLILALVEGLEAGLLRLGWVLPSPWADLAMNHGPLMVCGFFGGLLSLERAVAARSRWPYAAPLFLSLGILLLASGIALGGWFALLGALLFVAVSGWIFCRHPQLETALLTLGPLMLVVGLAAWLWHRPMLGVLAWCAFFVLMIAAERLELSRFRAPPPWARQLHLLLALMLAATLSLPPAWRSQIFGGTLLALTLWLWRYDIAWRSLRLPGLPRFTACSLLSGYFWLSLTALILISHPLLRGTPAYDAALHGLFLGFVFSMVFGHAPIIIPAVFRVALPYSPRFYLHLALLHLSVAWRLGSDAGLVPGHAWSGWLSVAAIALFLLNNLWQILFAQTLNSRPKG